MATAAPLLRKGDAAGLAWRALRHSAQREEPGADVLHQHYRFGAIRAVLSERALTDIWTGFLATGLDPILAKGWAAAQLYPEPGLRPYDDFDILVPPDQFPAAQAFLKNHPMRHAIDLHRQFAELADRSLSELYERSVLVSAGGVAIRVLGPEDHLRLLCQHLLRHGAWRAIWLCDIAAALECLPPGFDWPYFLSGSARRSDWVRCTLALTRQLLGTRACPNCEPAALPAWLPETVLQEWGRFNAHRPPGPLRSLWQRPYGRLALEELRCRWPNPIVATVFCGAAIAPGPRLPLQAANYLMSAALAAAGRSPARNAR